MMKIVLSAILFLLGCSLNAAAQKNYVLNADLEKHDSCPPNQADQIISAKYWSAIDSIGYPWCAPEYFNACAPRTSIGATLPDNQFCFQYPHSRNGVAHLIMFSDESDTNYANYLRDYLQGRFYKRLAIGKTYCVAFYINTAEFSKYAIKEFSAYLDNGSIDTSVKCGRPQTIYTPQITNTGAVITDTTNWIKIEGSFIANGNEQFITIGNFKDKVHTTYISLPHNIRNSTSFYATYLIDDVSVVESDTKADAGPDKHVGYGDSVYIGLPSAEAIWNSWTVLGSSIVIGEGPGIWVKPKATTSYVVTQTLCGTTTTDTVKVEVWAAGISSVGGQSQVYSLSPNPAKDVLTISQSLAIRQAVNMEIYDAAGRRISNATARFDGASSQLEVNNLPPGLYLLRIREDNGNGAALRFVKE